MRQVILCLIVALVILKIFEHKTKYPISVSHAQKTESQKMDYLPRRSRTNQQRHCRLNGVEILFSLGPILKWRKVTLFMLQMKAILLLQSIVKRARLQSCLTIWSLKQSYCKRKELNLNLSVKLDCVQSINSIYLSE